VTTNIDFLGKRFYAFILSGILILASLAIIATRGLNYGIDFVGGTELVIKTKGDVDIASIRRVVERLRVGDTVIQRFGGEEDREFLIRVEGSGTGEEAEEALLRFRDSVVAAFQDGGEETPGQEPGATEEEGSEPGPGEGAGETPPASGEEAPAADPEPEPEPAAPRDEGPSNVGVRIMEALRAELDPDRREGAFDLNAMEQSELALYLEPLTGEAEEARSLAERIVSYRTAESGGILTEWSQLDKMDDIPLELRPFLEQNAYLGSFVQMKAEVVGATIGKELRQKAMLAIVWSLAGILAYVWFRFELRFSVASIVALVHDVVITVGILALVGEEFSLPMIAALLTIVGYSLNDTIVVFDRVRENLRSMRGVSEEDLINTSLNQTLARTLITSGTTLMVVVSLLVLGGQVIHGFALALFIGIFVGTYSSIYVASPVVLYWRRLRPVKAPGAAGRPG